MIVSFLLLTIQICFSIEEITMRGPMDLQNAAMEEYMKRRREDSSVSLSDENNQFSKEVHAIAVNRLIAKPDADITILVC
jgi:hypothetical protein